MGRSWLAGLVMVAVTVAGCGDGDEESPTGSSDGTSTSSDTAAGDDTSASAALPVFCDLLTAEQIGSAIGTTVTTETGPFDACEFSEEDVRGLSGSLGATEVDTGNGGYEAYVSGASAGFDDPVEHALDGIGEQAFVTTGTFAGGSNLQAAGGALVGGTVYTVNLAQGNGLSEDEVVAAATALLTLMVDAAA